MGSGGYLHNRKERSQRLGPALLPVKNEEGRDVLGPAALVLGFRWKLHTPGYPGDREMGSVARVGWWWRRQQHGSMNTGKGKEPGLLR